MPRRKTEATEELKLGQIGDYWLSRRSNSPVWCRTWYDNQAHQTKRVSTRETDFRKAQASLAEWVGLNRIEFDSRDPKNVALHDVFVWYYESYAKNKAGAAASKGALAYWADHFNSRVMVGDLRRTDIDQFIAKLEGYGHAPGYIYMILLVGRAALNRARKYDMLTHVPHIPSNMNQDAFRDRNPKGRPLTVNELARLIHAQPYDHYRRFMNIMIGTICRPGAALELSPKQVDFDHGLVDLNPPGRARTNKRRPIVPLTPTLTRVLKEKVPALDTTPYVTFGNHAITSPQGGWRAMVRRAGLPDDGTITAYSIRHTMARELRAKKVAPDEISIFMGHKPSSGSLTTEIYAPYEPDYLSDVASAVESFAQRLAGEVDSLSKGVCV